LLAGGCAGMGPGCAAGGPGGGGATVCPKAGVATNPAATRAI